MYSLSIKELLKRKVIRTDQMFEFLNKMTDDEIKQYEKDIENILIGNGVEKKFPEWNSNFLSKTIDRDIMYKLLKNNKI